MILLQYVNIQDADKESPLHLAIDARNPVGVKYLLDKGRSPKY